MSGLVFYLIVVLKIYYNAKRRQAKTCRLFGAGERTRTFTPMAPAPKAGASANSATPAYLLNKKHSTLKSLKCQAKKEKNTMIFSYFKFLIHIIK